MNRQLVTDGGPNQISSIRIEAFLHKKIDLVVIDDFAISPIGPRERNDLLELLDDRVGGRSTLITSQLPLELWHDYIGDPTLADAILDRLLHNAHKIHIEGDESMRKRNAPDKQHAASKSKKN